MPVISEDQLDAIDSVIDSLCLAWQEDAAQWEQQCVNLEGANEALKKENAMLGKKKACWVRISLYEAAVIAAGAFIVYTCKN